MKKKIVNAKLLLTKKTITSLEATQSGKVLGGATMGNPDSAAACGPCVTKNPQTVCGGCPTGPLHCPTSGCA